jgi:hypothetical protein
MKLKRKISLVICIAMVSSFFVVSAYAASASTGQEGAVPSDSTAEELYEAYQAIVEQANEKYDLEMSVVPFEEMNQEEMLTEEEFTQSVEELAKFLLSPYNDAGTGNLAGELGATAESSTSGGTGTKTLSYVQTKTVENCTVYFTYSGSCNIGKDAQGLYYFISTSFARPSAQPQSSSALSLAYSGNLGKTLTDGNSTWKISQAFTVTKNNAVTGTYTAVAYFHLSNMTGVVTPSDY